MNTVCETRILDLPALLRETMGTPTPTFHMGGPPPPLPREVNPPQYITRYTQIGFNIHVIKSVDN